MIDGKNNPNIVPKQPELTETVENYLKRILWLTLEKGKVRVSDVAALMGRERSSASETIKRLSSDGYVDYEKYGDITLTDKGKEIAESINHTYILFTRLLVKMGIPEEIALTDACSMEHGISEVTIDKVSNFLSFIYENEIVKSELTKYLQQ